MKKWKLTVSQFGMIAGREPGLMATLRKGRVPRPRKEAQIRACLASPPPFSQTRASQIALKQRTNAEATMVANREAQRHRLTDPLESAKRHIQRHGWPVFSGRILDPPKKGWVVGSKPDPLTDEELLAMARRLGWKD